jgi:uncharacterized protein (TIGR03083 family)
MVTPQLLPRPTPCPAWDRAMLLGHITDSAEVVLHEAISAGRIGIRGAPGDPARSRGCAGSWPRCLHSGDRAGQPGAIGDRELTASMVAVTGAIEITVHGWDISVACGRAGPVPPGLAAVCWRPPRARPLGRPAPVVRRSGSAARPGLPR